MGFEEFKEHSVAEFFKKNKQMLGFSGKVRSLTTIVHEYVTNSLDAAEENRVLPRVSVEIKEIEKNDRYCIILEDNAGGIPKELIGKALGKILAGTKFHRYVQARGQQGIGAAGCTLYSYLTTGKSIKVVSGHKGKVVSCEVSIDIQKNEPVVNLLSEEEGDFSGLRITGEFADVKYEVSQYGVLEYLKRTALVNPACEILFTDPEGIKHQFPRSSEELPPKPKEVQPHPLGITAHDLFEMLKNDEVHRTIENALCDSLSRVSKEKVRELATLVPSIDLRKKPKEITWDEANAISSAMKKMKWIAPSLDSLVPVGEKQLEKALLSIINPQHYAIVQRMPKVYSGGIPFVVECALAYGGNAGRNNQGEVMRFANKVPLLFDAGACAITEAVKSIEWKRYNLKSFEEEPITLIVNVSSVFIPYTSAGKQSIASEEEILNEVRFAIMEAARNLQRYLSHKKREHEMESKRKALLRYVDQLSADIAELASLKDRQEWVKNKLVYLIENKYLNYSDEEEKAQTQERIAEQNIEEK